MPQAKRCLWLPLPSKSLFALRTSSTQFGGNEELQLTAPTASLSRIGWSEGGSVPGQHRGWCGEGHSGEAADPLGQICKHWPSSPWEPRAMPGSWLAAEEAGTGCSASDQQSQGSQWRDLGG